MHASTFFLVLRWSGTNFNIYGFFITAPILLFKYLYIMSIISTVLYILNKESKKNVLKKI